jgi:aryl-alcohol dehydrogenase-like predicted oxidoreductase
MARRLGRTDIEVTPIGLGCWQFSQGRGMAGKFWGVLTDAEISSIVKAGLDGGILFFDTAEIYGNGRSEQALTASLSGLGVAPGSVTIATKWFPIMRRAGSITRTIEERLSCLGGYPIDLHQIHQPLSLSSIPAQMREMARLLKSGKIRSVGVSNFSARQMELAHASLASEGIALASNQVRYNLLNRRIETNGVMESARRLGITVIAYSPLAQGILTGKFHDDPGLATKVSAGRKLFGAFSARGLERTAPLVRGLKEIARAHGATPSQVALAWLIGFHGEAVVAIPGASKPRHAEESAGAMQLTLSAKELSRIDELSREWRDGGGSAGADAPAAGGGA